MKVAVDFVVFGLAMKGMGCGHSAFQGGACHPVTQHVVKKRVRMKGLIVVGRKCLLSTIECMFECTPIYLKISWYAPLHVEIHFFFDSSALMSVGLGAP